MPTVQVTATVSTGLIVASLLAGVLAPVPPGLRGPRDPSGPSAGPLTTIIQVPEAGFRADETVDLALDGILPPILAPRPRG